MSEAKQAAIVVTVQGDLPSRRVWNDPNGWDVKQVIDALQGAGLVPCEVQHDVAVMVTELGSAGYGQPGYAPGTAAPARWCLVGAGWDETVAAVERALKKEEDGLYAGEDESMSSPRDTER